MEEGAEGLREVTMVGIAQAAGQLAEVDVTMQDVFQTHAQSQLVAIPVDRVPRLATKDAAEMEGRSI